MRQTYAEAKKGIQHRRCLRHPDKHLEVGINRETGEYAPQCNECRREGLEPLIGEALGQTLERSKRMVETAIAKREQGLQALSPQEVRTLLSVGKATDNEIRVFIRYCQAVNADPWARDVYLIKYSDRDPAAIVLALNWYLKRAAGNPAYRGYKAGLIVERNGEYITQEGAAVFPGDKAFAGWCEPLRHGATFSPVVVELEKAIRRFPSSHPRAGTPMGRWATDAAEMVEITAIRRAIRRGFPEDFHNESETDLPVVLEGEVEEVPSEAAAATLARTKEALDDAIQGGKEGPPLDRGVASGFDGVTQEMEASSPQMKPPRDPVPPRRRFHTVTEFWTATEEAGWTRAEVAGVLGPSIGGWLNDRSKEWGRFATWDDAYEALVAELGIAG